MNLWRVSFMKIVVFLEEMQAMVRLKTVKAVLTSCLLVFMVSANAQDRFPEQLEGVVDESGYEVQPSSESEFDNQSDTFVKDWRKAAPDYEDTVFGERMYNEPSVPTKLEMLRLLSKDTPSTMVFMHAISMGLELDEVLQAAVKYEPSKGRDLASSAVSLIPIMSESTAYLYSSYELNDLDRDDKAQPYSVAKVIDRFFKDRLVLRPYPDWFGGQYHFLASAAELKSLQTPKKETKWYKSKSSEDASKRPIFVSLYEGTGSVLIDSNERIEQALQENANALLPVVFIFNRINERSVDELTYTDKNDKQGRTYPRTIRGVQDAYLDKNLMLTPAPEWQIGDYQLLASVDEFSEVFDIPSEQDFEPEAWQQLLLEAKKYSVNNTSFLVAIVDGGDDQGVSARVTKAKNQRYATWDNPRTEGRFKYVKPKHGEGDGEGVTLASLLSKGLTLNRPDLIAALKTLGISDVPVSFYYLDSARVKPYKKGPRALIQAAIGAGTPPGSFGGSGGFLPPPVEVPPVASPPGIQ